MPFVRACAKQFKVAGKVKKISNPYTNWFWLIAGINGAGKSTLVNQLRNSQVIYATFYNPDAVTNWYLKQPQFRGKHLNDVNKHAADRVMELVMITLETTDGSIAVETVLSTDKYRDVVKIAHANNRNFGFVYIGLESADQAILRVKDRVHAGGHDVPENKVRSRWQRSLDQLPWFAQQADKMFVYSNARTDQVPLLLAVGDKTGLRWSNKKALPQITKALGGKV